MHLIARLKVIEAHVCHLARERGLEDAFAAELTAVARAADEARRGNAREPVGDAIEELRALARRLAAAPRTGRTLTDARGAHPGERAATLERPDGPEGR